MSDTAAPPGERSDLPDWEAGVVLRDGSTTHIRPIRPRDADALQRFHLGQSEHSTYLRFFAALGRLSNRELERLTTLDGVDRAALVAVRPSTTADGSGEDIIGVARFERVTSTEADVAFNIADAEQGKGLGSVLLEHIAAAARERGVRRFTADVLPENSAMLAVFREAGYDVSQHEDDGVMTVAVDLDPTERSRRVMADREHRAEARSMQALLAARSLLVVGPTGVGDERDRALAARTLAAASTDGRGMTVHAVGDLDPAPGVFRWPSVDRVAASVDLAAVALEPAAAIGVVPALSRLGVRGIVLLSGGYADRGAVGSALQRELLRVAHTHGVRIIGPASYGLVTGPPGRRFVASLGSGSLEPGVVGLFCQSASASAMLTTTAARRGLGVSTFVSAGGRADVSGNDVLQFWHEDPDTKVACLYVEAIGDPRKFSRVARRLAAVKPVVVVSAGRTAPAIPAGRAVRATRAPHRTMRDMFARSGVIHAENLHHMLDIAQLIAHQPLPDGRRIGIVATSPALVALARDAVIAAGLEASVTAVAPEDGDAARISAGIDEVYGPDACDAVLAVDIPVLAEPVLARPLASASARTGRPTVASVLGLRGVTEELRAVTPDGPHTIPAYPTPEDAVAALAAVVGYVAWRRSDRGVPVRPAGIDRDRARALVTGLLDGVGGGVRLTPDHVAELLDCYGVHLHPSIRVSGADEAVAAAERVGWPVALKSTHPALRHRADLGAVRLNVSGDAELRAAVAGMGSALAGVPHDDRLEVQTMVRPGVACVVWTAEDPLFGPVVTFGLAGDAIDLLGDLSSGVPPLTDTEVASMVRSVRASPRLFGYRGSPVADVAALEDLIARVSVLTDDLPEVSELELHPVLVSDEGLAVLGASARLASAMPRADTLRRLLD